MRIPSEVDVGIWAEAPFGTMYKVGTVAVEVTDAENGVELDVDRFTERLREALDDAE